MSFNMMRTAMLLAAMTALFLIVGGLLGGATGMFIALLIAAGTNLFAWWNSDRLALASAGAEEVDATTAPDLVRLVGELAQRAGLPMPRVYVVHSDQPNAFATGRNPENSAVAVNTGLVNMLTREELAGVIAHELAHIKNRDTLTMTISAALAGAISSIAQFGFLFGGRRDNGPGLLGGILVAVLAPLAASIVQMAVSRGREYEADRLGAEICGNPHWLASALAKISGGVAAIPDENAERHPAMAHMYIYNPLSGAGMDSLFSTHPNVENRIAALRELAAQMGVGAPSRGWAPFREERGGSFLGGGGVARRGPWA